MSWTLTKKLAQKRSRAGRWHWARERVGLLLLKLFPNGGATDIVSVTLFCIAVGTAIAWCGGRCAMPDGHCLNILLFWRRSTAALVFRVGSCFEVSLFCPPFSHSSPSLIGLLTSVDVKQQTLPLHRHRTQELCESRGGRPGPSWAFRPNEPYGFCRRKATLNHAHALVSVCPQYVNRHHHRPAEEFPELRSCVEV